MPFGRPEHRASEGEIELPGVLVHRETGTGAETGQRVRRQAAEIRVEIDLAAPHPALTDQLVASW